MHPSSSGRELDGVRHEVHDHLIQAQPVAPHGDGVRLHVERQVDALLLGRTPERLDGLLDQRVGASEGGVAAVMVVEVEPAVKGAGAGRVQK